MFIIVPAFTVFLYIQHIIAAWVLSTPSRSCDLPVEIYGRHQRGNKHMKTFFNRAT